MSKIRYSIEKLEEAVKNSLSIKECAEKLGLEKDHGCVYTQIRNRIRLHNINTNHFLSRNELIKRIIKEKGGSYRKKIPLNEILTENSIYLFGDGIKKKLYEEKLKKPICELCGQDENWKTGKIQLILDHINGIHNDNRLENLRIICPNCDATLPTFKGKNRKKLKKKSKINDFSKEEKNQKFILKTQPKIELILKSNIDFTKRGWRLEVAKLLNIFPQRAGEIIKNYLPEIWDKAFKNKTRI